MYANNLFTLNNITTLSSVQFDGMMGDGMSAAAGPALGDMSVCPTDRVFVSAVQYGRTIFERVITGVASVAEIMDSVRDALGRTAGLFTVSIRNASQGWIRRRTIRFSRCSMPLPSFAQGF